MRATGSNNVLDRLTDIVRREVAAYAGFSLNATAYRIFDEEQAIYAVMSVGQPQVKHPVRPMVIARIQDDVVIIDADNTDKPLVEALLQAGIPREKIVLAYHGEQTSHPAT